MPQDDVTDESQPLRGGRQRANHIQVHRIEAGLWERENILKPLGKIADTTAEFSETARLVKTAAIAAGGTAAIGAVWVAYNIGKSLYEWTDDAIGKVQEGWEVATAPSPVHPVVRLIHWAIT